MGRVQPRAGQEARLRPAGDSGPQGPSHGGDVAVSALLRNPRMRPPPPRGLERSLPALGWRAGSFLAPSLLPPQRASVQLGGCSCTARPQETASVAAPGSTGGHSSSADPQVLSLPSGRLSGLGPVVSLITAPAFPVPLGRWAASTPLLEAPTVRGHSADRSLCLLTLSPVHNVTPTPLGETVFFSKLRVCLALTG